MKLLKTVTQGMSLTHSSLPLITSQNNTLVKAYEAYDLVKGENMGTCCFLTVQCFFWWTDFNWKGKLVGISPLLILLTFCQNLSIFRTGNTARLVVLDGHLQDSRSTLYWDGGRGSKQADLSLNFQFYRLFLKDSFLLLVSEFSNL